MQETAEAHLQHLDSGRVCVMEIKNCSSVYCCYKPQVFSESGCCFSPPTPTLCMKQQEVCSFIGGTASGAVGVLTYELFNTKTHKIDGTMAIMFSVPRDNTSYKNWLGVGLFESNKACDKELYDEMYNKECTSFMRQKADGSGIAHCGVVDVRACMSDDGRAIVKLELYDKMY